MRLIGWTIISSHELFLPLSLVNRRLDEWVTLDQLDLESLEAPGDDKLDEVFFFPLVTNPRNKFK